MVVCFSSSYFLNIIFIGILWCSSSCGVTGKQSTYYQNQFAVHIPSGKTDADEIASRHGFVNLGKNLFFD
ncbi:hypothetical protein Phum_PHUM019010 [Pediculus humanus corporis]|uniref:Peptidase S8 pro-domain domain-containing protein n=1 Tax=Pediculus humanus subsp. corporis TaxID=121224 RepID=E0V9P4_PEDHC|nr:uncharacterized protein Phum_PHUM019010 [Pediculus humanus corporis]EEB10113.1 hypothetical protein Phum_PHUM019010 [Pediculus humanus corporis]